MITKHMYAKKLNQTYWNQDRVVDCHALLLCITGLTVAEEIVSMHQYLPCITSAETATRLTWGLAEISASTLPSVAIASLFYRSCILHYSMPWLVSKIAIEQQSKGLLAHAPFQLP